MPRQIYLCHAYRPNSVVMYASEVIMHNGKCKLHTKLKLVLGN